ncbi:MAG: dihydropteroate synthase [Anaerolineaceae bacterium]|nr:dihydropteroate synthase [Anaerolineaceae bacterium]
MALVYISAGSNQGNRGEYLRMAAQLLSPAVRVLRTSELYLTEPWGYKPQPSFYNLVWEAETDLDPDSLLKYFKTIENRIGRVKTLRYGPRVIDLDILLYDDKIYQSQNLTIPHAMMRERRFVLQPLCDLIPMEQDPVTKKTWFDLLQACPESGVEKVDEKLDYSKPVVNWGLRTYTMGIVNLTPDSFSGDGLLTGQNMITGALRRCEAFLESGADILDFGAESTRPGFEEVPEKTEIQRLVPVLKEVRRRFPKALLSVDSRKAEAVKAALDCGIDWINNTGDSDDKQLDSLCAGSGKVTVLMRINPLRKSGEEVLSAEKIMERVRSQLLDRVSSVQKYGMKQENIVLDPGIGFGSSPSFDLEIIRQIRQISLLGFPVLLGVSRKSFLGRYLQRPVDERIAGTSAVICYAILNGCDVIRVHDVKFMKDIAIMSDMLRKQ